MNAASQGSGVGIGGMPNHGAFPHQNVSEAYRYANLHLQQQQRQQQDFMKPANPPLKMLVPSEMVGAIIGALDNKASAPARLAGRTDIHFPLEK